MEGGIFKPPPDASTKHHDLADGDIIVAVDGVEFLISDWGEAMAEPCLVITADGNRLKVQSNYDDVCDLFNVNVNAISIFVGLSTEG